jgi:tetratricopeptide (TPR) repeat protein/CHAT domain-containing protein
MSKILDFQIQPLSTDAYSLTVCERHFTQPSQQLVAATFRHRVDFLTDFSVGRLNTSTKDPAVRFDELRKIGEDLYQKLFSPAIEQVWQEYKEQSEFLILCLRFSETATNLEVLPWETLHDGTEFVAAGAMTTITRLPLDVAPPSELLPIPLPLKLFGFFASPLDLRDHERLNVEREQEILLEAINNPAGQGRMSADFEDEAKLEILERSLLDGYHILHFTGHGISPREGGGLLLEDAHGNRLPTSIAELVQAVESGVGSLRLAVISGCQTARTLHAGAFSDLARELLRQRVPAVIAMQFSITDEGGLIFAEVLYKEIARGVELERAVDAARRAMLKDERFFINNDALAIVLLTGNGACLQTADGEGESPKAEPGATYLGDRLDPLARGFYGRRREYRKIRDAVLHQDRRAIIIHGIGGIGKTALLTHAINRLRPRFKDVMSFDCRRAALAPETILLELHRYFAMQGMPQLQPLIGRNVPPEKLAHEIARRLTDWPLLIVFDNFEMQLDEHRAIASEHLHVFLMTLVRTTETGSRFLFTTRHLFDLDGGQRVQLSLSDLSRPEALMLMQKLPNLAQASYRDKLAALEKFGGHPYALDMLDRHCGDQSLEQALQDVSLFQSKLREFLAIELNYRRLSARACELLNRLAAFRQGVPFEAAEWVIGKKLAYAAEHLAKLDRSNWPDEAKAMGDDEHIARLETILPERREAADVARHITELIEWGLLTPQIVEGKLDGLLVHNLVRDFCREQQTGKRWQIYLRDAAAFYVNLTKLTEQDDMSQMDVWGEMEAFELLMEAEEYMGAAELLTSAHRLLERWGFGRFLANQYVRLRTKVGMADAATISINLGIVLQGLGEYESALGQYEASLPILEEVGNRAVMASALHEIGRIHQLRGEYEAALARYEASLRIERELENNLGVAISLHQMGMIRQALKDYDAASREFETSRQMYEEIGDRAGVATALHSIGIISQVGGDYELALIRYEKSLQIRKELGDRAGIATSLHQIGMIQQTRGEFEAALERYEAALCIKEELGNSANVAITQAQIANLLMELKQYAEAFPRLLFALVTFAESKAPSIQAVAMSLAFLRAHWGATNFDAAYRQAMGEEVPAELRNASEAAEGHIPIGQAELEVRANVHDT